ncbi:Fe-S protein assembly co-chaperone HscB [Buchnera aphidicola (Taiwanaphis decaspermi)]|uniref:Fe-S protein assembly co-chaperone HscB n=1 Tax=Buchnera aphidicola TaxID=9 RepID=UPI0031B8183C
MNYFDVLKIPKSYKICTQTLRKNFYILQKKYHPDNNLNKNISNIKKKNKKSMLVNEAYQVLKNFITRAEYFLSLNGFILSKQEKLKYDKDFLLQQIKTFNYLKQLKKNIKKKKILDFKKKIYDLCKHYKKKIYKEIDKNKFEKAIITLLKVKFFYKIRKKIKKLIDKILLI